MVEGSIGRRHGRGEAASGDNGRASLLYGADKLAAQPVVVGNDFGGGTAVYLALSASGYWVALWLPQMVTLLTAVTGTPAFSANWE
jgi:hypothetical protein